MKLINKIRKLCTPAYVYLVISVIAMVAMMIQNGGNSNEFCVGVHSCEVENKGAIFIAQGLYTAFWVFVLDSICKAGHKNISWFLVLLPYILLFIMLAMFILGNKKHTGFMEGFEGKDDEDKKKKDKKDPLKENSAADNDNDHDNKDKDKDMNGHGGDDHGDDKPEMKDGEKDDKKEGMNMHYQMINGACTQVDDPQPNLDMYSDSSCTKKANNIG